MARKKPGEAEKTREVIIKTAARMLESRGYDGTSLSAVAAEAGMTRGAVYWHFKNKDDLLLAVCRDLAENNPGAGIIRQGQTDEYPLECLRRWLAGYAGDREIRFFASPLFDLIHRILHEKSKTRLREELLEIIGHDREELQGVIRNAVTRGHLPADTDIEQASDILVAFVAGYIDLLSAGLAGSLLKNFQTVADMLLQVLSTVRLPAKPQTQISS